MSDKISNSSCAGNNYILASKLSRPGSSVSAHSSRFNHRTIIKRHPLRKFHYPVLRHYKIILSSTICLKSLDTKILTHIILSTKAGTALAADQLRTGGSIISRLHRSDSASNSNNLSRIFMSLNHRIEGGRMQSVIRMDLTTAYAYAFYIQQYLIILEVSYSQIRNSLKLKVFRFC